jgi:hypothetical protein
MLSSVRWPIISPEIRPIVATQNITLRSQVSIAKGDPNDLTIPAGDLEAERHRSKIQAKGDDMTVALFPVASLCSAKAIGHSERQAVNTSIV